MMEECLANLTDAWLVLEGPSTRQVRDEKER